MKLRDTYFTDIILLLLFASVTLLFLFIPLLSTSYLKAVFGIIFVSFLPGYSFISYLFPNNESIKLSERLLLSFATSVAIVTLLGFILNYTPFGIHLEVMAIILYLFIVIFAILALFRRRNIHIEHLRLLRLSGVFNYTDMGNSSQLFETEVFNPEFKPTIIRIIGKVKMEDQMDKTLSIVLAILIILTITMTTYAIVKPKPVENFTEFYIQGEDGMSNYTTTLNSGQNGNVTVVIVNHENEPVTYLMVFNLNGTKVSENSLTLQNGEQQKIPINFTAGNPGQSEVEFLLFKQPDLQNVYLSLHYWITIS
jgi:uncharacterized membrane protein